jgi:hypothetical protein
MSERYPGYDVMRKRWSPSWNDATRRAVDARLSVHPGPRFLSPERFATLRALCARILPQPPDREPIPLAAYIDDNLVRDRRIGWRDERLPPLREAWTRGLDALDAEGRAASGRPFAALSESEQDALIERMRKGELRQDAWGDMPCAAFFKGRVMDDIPRAYYAHPIAWNEIGFGGPASPRGYVRLDFGRRDPWEAAEAAPGQEMHARRENARAARS